MISAYTGTQIRAAEQPLLDAGVGAVLMQRAAYGLANTVIGELRGRGQRLYGSSVTVLAGPGNNGGDGLFAAAILAGRGLRATAILTAGTGHDAGLAAFRRAGGRVEVLDPGSVAALAGAAAASDVVVDAVLGTGARGGLRGTAGELFGLLARNRPALVIACDLPSGVDADTGEAHPPILTADVTATFGAAKAGLLADPGADYAGRTRVIPIGIEPWLPEPVLRRLETAELSRMLPRPGRRAHKYTRGVLGVIAGSARYPGAAVLACQGALAAGVGMVRYLGPPEVAEVVRRACPEVVSGPESVPESHVQAWLVGPGIDEAAEDQLRRVRDAAATGLPMVADAGALPALPRILTPGTVLTPHAGELAGLLARYGGAPERAGVDDATLTAVRHAAARTGATVLLKGATTLVAAPGGAVFSQADGTPWMATAGSGDVLAGILGALLAQLSGPGGGGGPGVGLPGSGKPEFTGPDRWALVAAMAASLHGRAGDRASAGAPVTASGIAGALPAVLRELLGGT